MTTEKDPRTGQFVRQSAEQRFWDKVGTATESGCWPWQAGLDKNGYGKFRDASKRCVRALRFAYELLIGPIPLGLQIDHVKARGCISKSCVNPDHLEPVTPKENIQRIDRVLKTHCPHGHPYFGENLYVKPDGSRECRTCMRAKVDAYYQDHIDERRAYARNYYQRRKAAA